jgi:hypothetical protein
MPPESDINEVKKRHSAELMNLPGVSGVGVAKGKDGNLVIAIYVDQDDADVIGRLPKEIEGHTVDVVHSGPFQKF